MAEKKEYTPPIEKKPEDLLPKNKDKCKVVFQSSSTGKSNQPDKTNTIEMPYELAAIYAAKKAQGCKKVLDIIEA